MSDTTKQTTPNNGYDLPNSFFNLDPVSVWYPYLMRHVETPEGPKLQLYDENNEASYRLEYPDVHELVTKLQNWLRVNDRRKTRRHER